MGKLSEIEILDLLENYIAFKNDPKVIETFIDILRERKHKKEAMALEELLEEIKFQGGDVIALLYEKGLIKTDTFQILKVLEEKSMLTIEAVREIKELKSYFSRIDKELMGMLYQPLLSIVLTFITGIFIDKQAFKMFHTLKIPIPSILIPHKILVEYPFVGIPIGLAIIFIATYGGVKWFLNSMIGTEKRLFEIASISSILSRAKIPIKTIFQILADNERQSKWKKLFIEIADNYSEKFEEQLKPLINKLDENIAVGFIIASERSESMAWEFLKEKMKEKIASRVEKTKSIYEAMVNFLPWIVILIIASPMIVVIKLIMDKVALF